MRGLVVALVALAALAFSGTAQAGLEGCFGGAVDKGYVAAFDKLPGQGGTNGTVDLPYQAWYRGAQSWGTKHGEAVGHHSHHVHVEGCIPNGQTMTGPFTTYFAFTFHNFADYRILSASFAAVTRPDGNSAAIWRATPEQVAQLQAAADASSAGEVKRVFLTVPISMLGRNGFKEVRGGIATEEDGPEAIFHTWHFDPRWYYTQNVAGLPWYDGMGASQNAIRNRPLIVHRNPDGTLTATLYHHAGWCRFLPQALPNPEIHSDCPSKNWGRSFVRKGWSGTADKTVELYISDGGGDVFVMIDPDFHRHYNPAVFADRQLCPNIDEDGNCLGVWYWHAFKCCKMQFPQVTIPASVISSLSPGLHKLVLRSDDPPECEREGRLCPSGTRGTWSNIEVLPIRRVLPNA